MISLLPKPGGQESAVVPDLGTPYKQPPATPGRRGSQTQPTDIPSLGERVPDTPINPRGDRSSPVPQPPLGNQKPQNGRPKYYYDQLAAELPRSQITNPTTDLQILARLNNDIKHLENTYLLDHSKSTPSTVTTRAGVTMTKTRFQTFHRPVKAEADRLREERRKIYALLGAT